MVDPTTLKNGDKVRVIVSWNECLKKDSILNVTINSHGPGVACDAGGHAIHKYNREEFELVEESC